MALNNTYSNAMIFSLGHPYGTPTILSSYSFSTADTDAGAPNGGQFMLRMYSDGRFETHYQFQMLRNRHL